MTGAELDDPTSTVDDKDVVATDDVCIREAAAELEVDLAPAVCEVMRGAELDDPISTVDDNDVVATDDVFIVYEVGDLEEGLAAAVCDVFGGAELEDPTSTVDDKDVLATDDVISDADELAFSPVNVSQSSVSLKNVDARYG